MINIDYTERIEDNLYGVCIRCEEISEMKYGVYYIYNTETKTINCKNDYDKALLIALCILNEELDIMDFIQESINK